MEMCYKALFNGITRSNYDSSVNRRLIDKSQRLESVIEAMKERGESEEYIMEVSIYAIVCKYVIILFLFDLLQILETLTPPEREILEKVKIRIKNLYSAEIGLDETLFLFQMYQYYQLDKV